MEKEISDISVFVDLKEKFCKSFHTFDTFDETYSNKNCKYHFVIVPN